MLTTPTDNRYEKLFYVEREDVPSNETITMPEEYIQLILPYATVYYESDKYCDIISQHKQLGPFSFWVQEVYAHQVMRLCPYTPYHIWALHFMYDASLKVELYKDATFPLMERECNLFSLESDLHKVDMSAGQKLTSCHINIKPVEFREFVKAHPKLKRLASMQSKGVTDALHEHSYHTNLVCQHLLAAMLSCRHINRPADVFLFRCCLDLFYNFAQQDSQPTIEVKDVLHTNKLNQVFAFLVDKDYKDFSIPELARMSGLTVAELRSGFLQQFSIPLHHFLRMLKMMMVFELLTEKSTALSTIAIKAGYKCWQDLEVVFKIYYGCELEELRRAM